MSNTTTIKPSHTGQKPAGRSSRSQRVEVRVRLDRQLLGRLDALVASTGRSRNDLIREAIQKTWLGSTDGPMLRPDPSRVQPPAIDSMTAEQRAEWDRQFDEVLAGFRAGFAASGLSVEELETEIRAAREEVREMRRAERASSR